MILIPTLDKAWKTGITLQSDFYRQNSQYVAMAASKGLITTRLPTGKYSAVWRLTPRGCIQLFNTQEGNTSDGTKPEATQLLDDHCLNIIHSNIASYLEKLHYESTCTKCNQCTDSSNCK